MWWVEKFEAKRKAEARRKADDPTFLTTQERVAGTDADAGANPVVRLLTAVLQVRPALPGRNPNVLGSPLTRTRASYQATAKQFRAE